jgi:hypothetical protein
MAHARERRRQGAAAFLLFATLGAAGSTAWAVECKDLPSPIYGIGGSAQKPLFARVGKALTNASPPETFIYQAPGACLGPNSIISDTKLTGTASYWDAAGMEQTCNLPLVGQLADVGASGVFATECPGIAALPPDVGDFIGPVQPFTFIVAKGSSETVISAEAGYFAYGFGATGEASPWIDESQLIKRDANSAAAIIIALALKVPVEKLKGVDAGSNNNTVVLVTGSPNAQAALGFVSGEVAEANAAKVNVLAFQAYDQTCGYWPSSTSTTFDKVNVRDGHYALWAPSHFFARIDAAGKPKNPGAKKIIGYFDGSVPAPTGVDIPKIAITAGTIPDCAMRVKRSEDLGPLSSYAPAIPCGCYFDAVATGQSSCQACQSDGECAAGSPKCHYGYCEAY